MNNATRSKLVNWLSLYPDSTHPLDEKRFYDFVRESCLRRDYISKSDISTVLKNVHSEWSNEKIEGFADKYVVLIEQLQSFYDFCIQNEKVEKDKEDSYITDSIQHFVSSMFDLNYHEIYELVQAIEGRNRDMLNFFTIKDDGDIRTVTYTVSDIAYSFHISETRKIVEWIEDHYMEGMDAESWYGFQYALERSEKE